MVSDIPVVVPDSLPLHPIIPNGATAVQITELTQPHTADDIRVFKEFLYAKDEVLQNLTNQLTAHAKEIELL
jgi:hypothetical protein